MSVTLNNNFVFKTSIFLFRTCVSTLSPYHHSSLSLHSLADEMKKIVSQIPDTVLDLHPFCNDKSVELIRTNIEARKGAGDVDRVVSLHKQFLSNKNDLNLKKDLLEAALLIPNITHPEVLAYGPESRIVNSVGTKPVFPFPVKTFSELSSSHNLYRFEKIAPLCGEKSYFLTGHMATLETALVKYTLSYLVENGFQLISVPDILKKDVIKRCGMTTDGERHQIFKLDEELFGEDWCLSGTSEMAIANYLQNRKFAASELPLNFAAVSRCFRAETSEKAEEKGLYRVHQFTKVEMFSVCSPSASAGVLELFRSHEETLFANLGLHFQTLDMAAHELGAQAYRKYDIEAWMPGRKQFGEISSCSDCTDYQARRLNMKCDDDFAHTVNGTACAIPRLLLAIGETHQTEDGSIIIPEVLQNFTGFDKLVQDAEKQEKYSLKNVMTHKYKYWDENAVLVPKKKKKKKKIESNPA